MTTKPHHIDIHVGIRLRELRCFAGVSQTALAEGVGITFQQIQKYESGANRIAASRLWDLAQVLCAPVEAFFPSRPLPIGGLGWPDDPGFAQWVRLYRDAPAGRRRVLATLAKMLAEGTE